MRQENSPWEHLTPKQQAFVKHYLQDPNAAKAARNAGYSPKWADRTGYKNLQHPRVAAALQQARAEREAHAPATRAEVIEQLSAIARGTATARMFGADVSPTFTERIHALELLGRHLDMFGNKST